MKRSNAFFGLHFDFHATADTKGIGGETVAEKIGEYLDTVKPDYIQVDTKGHPGYTSFFSEYGDVAPGLVADHIKIIREETAKRGIKLIAHHSDIYDMRACREHPEWCAVKRDGTLDDMHIDPTSGYADKKLIPQLKKLAVRYGFDGAWLDGDCWAVTESYRPETVERFCEENGFKEIEEDYNSPSRLAFREYWRGKFTEHLRHVITELKKAKPDFEIVSNWAFGTNMPQKPIPEMPFLSGDATNASEIRMGTRCFAGKGKPWDIMSWGFSGFVVTPNGGCSGMAQKPMHRLYRESAMVIAMGGGYQIVNCMTPQGKIRMADMENMRLLAEFVRKRERWSYGAVPVKNAAVLYSDYDKLRRTEPLYGMTKLSTGLCNIVLDGGRPVDVIYDYQIAENDLSGRKTIILPDIRFISEEIKSKLLKFAEDGGSVVISGVVACKAFADAAGVKMTVKSDKLVHPRSGGYLYGVKGDIACFGGDDCTELVSGFEDAMDYDAPQVTLAVQKQYGSGKIILIGWDIFGDYNSTHRFSERDTMREILDFAEPKPVAYLEDGTKRADIIPTEKDKMLVVNVINTIEHYYDYWESGFGEIPPLTDITVAVKTSAEPAQVRLQPENITPEYGYDGEYIHVKIPRLDIHTIIEVKI